MVRISSLPPPWILVLGALAGDAVALPHDTEARIRRLTVRIERTPGDAHLYLARGELYRAHRDYKHALADYDRAGKLSPELVVVELARSRAYYEMAKYREGLACAERFLAERPREPRGLELRGRCLMRLGRHAEASKAFAAGLARREAPRPQDFLECADAFAAAGELDRALAILDRGTSTLGPIISLHERAIELATSGKRYSDALARLDTVLSFVNRKERWLLERALVCFAAGDSTQARADARAAQHAIAALPARHRSTRSSRELHTRATRLLRQLERSEAR